MSPALIDETELLFYRYALEQLKRQGMRIMEDPSLVLSLSFWEEEYLIMASVFAPLIRHIVEDAITFGVGDLASVISIDPVLDSVGIYAQNLTGELITNINNVTANQVREIMSQAVAEQWGLEELTESLTGLFGEVRAARIAVTETTNAYMGGAQMATTTLRGEGHNAVLVWLTANDDFVCPICAPRHLTVQGEPNANGETWTDAEAAHVNCRCNIAVYIREELEDL